jgi:GNAT superfamily N-acetyltransferase
MRLLLTVAAKYDGNRMNSDQSLGPIDIQCELRPGDLGEIVQLHGVVYSQEQGWDVTFEAYVAGPLAEFVQRCCPRERIWIAKVGGCISGCVAVVAGSNDRAQLRWFLVHPNVRGRGLGQRLLREAVSFARDIGYREMFLWTERSLRAAAHLYQGMGFRLTESRAGHLWGKEVVEEKFELVLS